MDDIQYEIQEREKALAFFEELKDKLDPHNYLDELENKINDCYEDIKNTCQFLSDKLHEKLVYIVIQKLRNSPPFDITGDEHDSIWLEIVAEYQSSGSILRDIWQDTIDSAIQEELIKLSIDERLGLMLSTDDGDEKLEWWKMSPHDAPEIKDIEDNISLSEVIEEIRESIITYAYDEDTPLMY